MICENSLRQQQQQRTKRKKKRIKPSHEIHQQQLRINYEGFKQFQRIKGIVTTEPNSNSNSNNNNNNNDNTEIIKSAIVTRQKAGDTRQHRTTKTKDKQETHRFCSSLWQTPCCWRLSLTLQTSCMHSPFWQSVKGACTKVLLCNTNIRVSLQYINVYVYIYRELLSHY